MRFKGVRPVAVLSAADEVVLGRRYYWGGGVGGCYPSDEKAGIAACTVTAGAREVCCVMGLANDFRTAAANLKRIGGLGVCPERLRQVVENEAAAVAARRDCGVLGRVGPPGRTTWRRAKNLPMLTAHILDFHHLAQHVHQAAGACRGRARPSRRRGRTSG